QEVHQSFESEIGQTIRVDPLEDTIEFDWVVGPIRVGTEVVQRISSDLKSNRTFYTDANGRQMMKRIWNYRPTWKLVVSEEFLGNYYPVTSRIALRDEKEGL